MVCSAIGEVGRSCSLRGVLRVLAVSPTQEEGGTATFICFLFSPISRLLNSSSMLCDCQLEWFPEWVNQAGHRSTVQAQCAHPEALLGQDIFNVESRDFTCGKLHVLGTTSKPNRWMTSSSIRFQPVSIVLNNDNRMEPLVNQWLGFEVALYSK